MASNYWKNESEDSVFVRTTQDDYREIANKALEYFKENNIPLIAVNEESGYPEWTFYGKDKQTGRTIISNTDNLSKEIATREIRANGYSVSRILPANIYSYAMNHVNNPDDTTIKVLNTIATQALKEWRKKRKL